MKPFDSITELELCSLAISSLCDKMKRLMEIVGDMSDDYGKVPSGLKDQINKITLQHAELTRRYIQIISDHD